MVKKPEWEKFEIAVANFIKALDPNAKVTHDAFIPDEDTGLPRQRDVWIEAKILQHFPIKLLVSCKRLSRKLSQQDIDAFVGELLSSGAHKGILYSFSGFADNALKKAKKKGISCCRLFVNEPPESPDFLIFKAYLFTPGCSLSIVEPIDPIWQINTFGELFEVKIPQDSNNISVLDYLENLYYERRKFIRSKALSDGSPPEDWSEVLEIRNQKDGSPVIRLAFGGCWHIYKGKLEAQLISGSYSFTEKEFKGSQTLPGIDNYGPNPGHGWEHIEKENFSFKPGTLVGFLYGGEVSVKESLLEFSNKKIHLAKV